MFFDYSSTFSSIQTLLLRDALTEIRVDSQPVFWLTNYLMKRQQFVRLKNRSSEPVVCSPEAPQGTVLSPDLFILYTSDFKSSSESCHMHRSSDDTAIAWGVRGGQEEDYRSRVEDFVTWSRSHLLQVNTSKTKEMVVDLQCLHMFGHLHFMLSYVVLCPTRTCF